MMFNIDHPEVVDAVHRALYEDAGTGDVTTEACISGDLQGEGQFTARQEMVVAGSELLYLLFDEVRIERHSGEPANDGQVIATVRGPAQTLLTRERVALNFLQRL